MRYFTSVLSSSRELNSIGKDEKEMGFSSDDDEGLLVFCSAEESLSCSSGISFSEREKLN